MLKIPLKIHGKKHSQALKYKLNHNKQLTKRRMTMLNNQEYITSKLEEIFRDLNSYGFNMEGTWIESIKYFENLYLYLCIAYTWMIILD